MCASCSSARLNQLCLSCEQTFMKLNRKKSHLPKVDAVICDEQFTLLCISTTITNARCCQPHHPQLLHSLKPRYCQDCHCSNGSGELFHCRHPLHHCRGTQGQHYHKIPDEHHTCTSVYRPFWQRNTSNYHDNILQCTCITPIQLLLPVQASDSLQSE